MKTELANYLNAETEKTKTEQRAPKPSFGELRTATKHYGPSDRGTPYISDGDSARVLFFFNMSGAYGGYAGSKQAKDDAAFIVRATNNHALLIGALESLLAYEDDRPPVGTFGAEIYAEAANILAKAKE